MSPKRMSRCTAIAAAGARRLLLALALLASPAIAAPTAKAIDSYLAENIERTHLPGVAAAVVSRHGIVYLGGHGSTSDSRRIGPDTPLRVGSISKSFTAFAVMQLVDRGKVDLDAPVQHYVAQFGAVGRHAGQVTVRQLLNQTSGLSDASFAEMHEAQPQTLEQAVGRLSGARNTAPPGTRWNYHNPNYHVLARLVELVDGRPFAAYLRAEIFEPLGMSRTATVLRARQSAFGIADGYSPIYGAMVARPIPDHFIAGSGGVISTARDMGKWLQMHLHGGRTAAGRQLLSSASLQLMLAAPGGVAGDYGFGWDTDRLAGGGRRIKHGGLLFTFSSEQSLYPELGYGVVLLFNSAGTTGAEQMGIIDGVAEIVRGRAPEPAMSPGRLLDAGLAAVASVIAIIGIWNIRRSRRWAARWAHRPRLLLFARLAAGLIPLAIFLSLPMLWGLAFGGRDVTWTTGFFAWPAIVIMFAALALFALATFVARVRHLRGAR